MIGRGGPERGRVVEGSHTIWVSVIPILNIEKGYTIGYHIRLPATVPLNYLVLPLLICMHGF